MDRGPFSFRRRRSRPLMSRPRPGPGAYRTRPRPMVHLPSQLSARKRPASRNTCTTVPIEKTCTAAATWKHERCAVTLLMVCGFGILTTTSRSFRDKKCNQEFSKNAANRARKCKKHPFTHRLAIIGIRTATPSGEVNTHEVKKRILFDDESYGVKPIDR